MKTLRQIILAALAMAVLLMPQVALAVRPPEPGDPAPGGGSTTNNPAGAEALCTGSGGMWANGVCTDGGPSLMQTIGTITNVLLFILGAIAVIMIIIGGIRYVTSAGDQAGVTAAKNTVLYAIVGLLVAIISFAIVNFVTATIK